MGAIALRCNIAQLITRNYKDLTFAFREDGYFNMTKAAQCFGKDVNEFIRIPCTIKYVEALVNTGKFPELKQAKSGRYGGTWAHFLKHRNPMSSFSPVLAVMEPQLGHKQPIKEAKCGKFPQLIEATLPP